MNIEDIKEGMLVEVIHEESLGILNSEVLEMIQGGIIISGGEKVKVKIHNFDVTEGKALTAVLIRCTNNHGEYIVGCRMIEDNQKILEYVEKMI